MTVLVNDYGEYVKTIDNANGKLILTPHVDEAYDYNVRMGGGEWSANNERDYIINFFKDEFKDRVTTLCVTHADD